MEYLTHQPPTPLGEGVIEVIWFRGFQPDHSIERLVPTGHPSIICCFDGMPRHTFDNATHKPLTTLHDIWLYGMHRHYLSISAHPDSEMLVLRFATPGALPFLHEPLARYNDRIEPKAVALGGALGPFHAALAAAEGGPAKFAVVDAWLADRFDASLLPSPALLETVRQLRASAAGDLASVVDAYPHSHKTLIDHFKRHIGLTPKYYHRLLRFYDVFRRLEQGVAISWAEIALDCGYTDQSHFVREFRHFSGFTPAQFRAAGFEPEVSNYFPLDGPG
jgi:AraC-like DNA-binding protein